jgi:hypothetical protein
MSETSWPPSSPFRFIWVLGWSTPSKNARWPSKKIQDGPAEVKKIRDGQEKVEQKMQDDRAKKCKAVEQK